MSLLANVHSTLQWLQLQGRRRDNELSSIPTAISEDYMGVVYIVCGRPQIFNLQKDKRISSTQSGGRGRVKIFGRFVWMSIVFKEAIWLHFDLRTFKPRFVHSFSSKNNLSSYKGSLNPSNWSLSPIKFLFWRFA